MMISSLTYQWSCCKHKVRMSVTRFWKSVTGDLKLMGYHLPFQWAAERDLLMKWCSTMSFYSAKQCWTNFFWGCSIIRYSVLVNGLSRSYFKFSVKTKYLSSTIYTSWYTAFKLNSPVKGSLRSRFTSDLVLLFCSFLSCR